MGAIRGSSLLALFLLPASSAPAWAAAYHKELFPPAEEVFVRLMADPRQDKSTVRYYRADGENLGDSSLGNTWGLLRWVPKDPDGWTFQLGLSGMAYSRFRLSGGVNEFQAIDFFASVPLELRRGAVSGRIKLFHESSHLGDDYIRRTKSTGFRYSIDGFGVIASWDAHPLARLYGGGALLMHGVPSKQWGGLQYGFELKTRDLGWVPSRETYFYLAQDFQNNNRVDMNLNSRTEFGVRVGIPRVVRSLRVHAGYFAGHSELGQFYTVPEHYFDLGITFDF